MPDGAQKAGRQSRLGAGHELQVHGGYWSSVRGGGCSFILIHVEVTAKSAPLFPSSGSGNTQAPSKYPSRNRISSKFFSPPHCAPVLVGLVVGNGSMAVRQLSASCGRAEAWCCHWHTRGLRRGV
ncbi:hypothetical protein SETIT_2G389100v2 [Setaria italica]|uniref:Uncharacterized protein n=1 Tax=Setaria italica TaxID=4555 RepID=A0A368Q7G9_SETIT|nr:hypothetical protein SETIT_2G389100v2 [Setaria italica]